MSQLALFEGPHVPRTAAREALSRGDLGAARDQLAQLGDETEEAADATRLGRILSALEGVDAPERVHGAFASVLAAELRGFLSDGEWFRLYAQRVARSLEGEPTRHFRGWLGAHFALAAGEADAAADGAARIVASAAPGPEWIEAARVAFALGRPASAGAWIHAACLDSPGECPPDPPALERSGIAALDAAPALPALPAPVESLFEAVAAVDDLPPPRTRWVAVVGEIDRILAPEEPGETAGDAAPEPETHGEDPVRAFLAALRAARRSRERDGARSADRCSDRELRARRRMQRLAPGLFERYLRGLGGTLF